MHSWHLPNAICPRVKISGISALYSWSITVCLYNLSSAWPLIFLTFLLGLQVYNTCSNMYTCTHPHTYTPTPTHKCLCTHVCNSVSYLVVILMGYFEIWICEVWLSAKDYFGPWSHINLGGFCPFFFPTSLSLSYLQSLELWWIFMVKAHIFTFLLIF